MSKHPFFSMACFLLFLGTYAPLLGQHDYSSVYHIQLMVCEKPVDLPYLNDLGFVKLTSLERGPADSLGMVRVLLGPYLGMHTADHVIHQIWDRGFTEAKLIKGALDLKEGEGSELTHTVQVGAFRRMHLEKYKQLSNLPAYGMYIIYEEGLFKVLSGLYKEQDAGYLWKTVIPYYQKTMGLDGFVRRFR